MNPTLLCRFVRPTESAGESKLLDNYCSMMSLLDGQGIKKAGYRELLPPCHEGPPEETDSWRKIGP